MASDLALHFLKKIFSQQCNEEMKFTVTLGILLRVGDIVFV
jgi:hypothetical protein